MNVYQEYEKKRVKLVEKMSTLKEFEKEDEIVGLVFEIARQMVGGSHSQDVEWLLRKGMQLAQYAGVLDGRANESWGEFRSAELAYKSVRDALIIASKSEHDSVTAAKAAASRSTEDSEVDVLAREQRSKNYAIAADMCNRIVMFIQTTIRWREKEYMQSKINSRGAE